MTLADADLRFQPDTSRSGAVITGQRVGYTRVSTLEQNTDRQLEGIDADRTFTDHVSGKDLNRPQLEAMLAFVRDSDTVLVHSMGRLARNLDDLRATVRGLTARGVRVQFIKEQLTFTGDDTAMATLLLSVMGAFAEFERASSKNANAKESHWPNSEAPTAGDAKRSPPTKPSNSVLVPPRANRRQRWPASSVSAARPSTNTCAPTRDPAWRELSPIRHCGW